MRALIIGSLCSVTIGLLAPWAIYIMRGSYMALDYSTPAAISLFFLLALANRWLHLSKSEMVVIYSMMVLACVVPTGGLIAPLLAGITGPYYYTNGANQWESLITQHLPLWATPASSISNDPIVNSLYEGGFAVPWVAWGPALLTWGIFFAALFTVMVCLMILLRKQWVENERLAFPLTALPIELIEGQLVKHKWFWIGCAVPLLAGTMIGLHNYFPAVPRILPARLSFPLLGYFYLTDQHSTLSLWVFGALAMLSDKASRLIPLQTLTGGYGASNLLWMYLGAGAMLAMVFIKLKAARRTLCSQPMLGKVVGLCTLILLVWLLATGMSLVVAVALFLIAIVITIGMTRVIAETGLAVAGPPVIAPVLVAGLLGHRLIGAASIANLAQSFVWTSEATRVSIMASAASVLKVTTRYKLKPNWQHLAWAVGLAGAAALWLTLSYGHKHGLASNWYFDHGTRGVYSWAAAWNREAFGPSKIGWLLTLAGAGGYWLMSNRYLMGSRWAPHPVGLIMAGTPFLRLSWLSCFLSWAYKTLCLKWLGRPAYQSSRPFFLGLIAGQYSTNLLWLGVDKATGHTGNMIFWI